MKHIIDSCKESKKKIILSAVVAALTIIAAVPLFVVSGMIEMENGIRIMLIVIGIIVILTEMLHILGVICVVIIGIGY